jgi:hypothetical protein
VDGDPRQRRVIDLQQTKLIDDDGLGSAGLVNLASRGRQIDYDHAGENGDPTHQCRMGMRGVTVAQNVALIPADIFTPPFEKVNA